MIVIVDYGLGNIKAFANVYRQLNIPFHIAKKAADLDGADKIILPGVGAFDFAMKSLSQSGMKERLETLVLKENIPVLGVCVGMQMLAASSEEGKLPGLGWIDATVRKIKPGTADIAVRLPHMGWNSVQLETPNQLWTNIDAATGFYFLHSYFFDGADSNHSIGRSTFGQLDFTCAVNKSNIFGVQFHPEKSHRNGVQLLKNFADQ